MTKSPMCQRADHAWASSIEAGNVHFKNGDYLAAQAFYEQALTLESHLLQTAIQQTYAPETIHLYVISCYNLANVHQRLEQWAKAEEILRQAYDIALNLMTRRALPLPVRAEGYQGFFAAFQRLVEFYGQRSDRASCDALINHAKPLALEFLQEMM